MTQGKSTTYATKMTFHAALYVYLEKGETVSVCKGYTSAKEPCWIIMETK